MRYTNKSEAMYMSAIAAFLYMEIEITVLYKIFVTKFTFNFLYNDLADVTLASE